MIVRIMADNQYRIDDDASMLTEIEQLDGRLFTAVETNDEGAFHDALTGLIDHVHHLGQPVSDEEVVASDVIVPPADMTVAETRKLLLQEAAVE